MTFANPLPAWALVLVVCAALAVGWFAYRGTPLPWTRRAVLGGLRVAILLLLVLFLMRPVARAIQHDARDAVVAVLVDTSRSMRIQDAAGTSRIARAGAVLSGELLPLLQDRLQVEVLGFDAVLKSPAGTLDGSNASRIPAEASGNRSDIAAALSAARDRFRGRPLAGLILVSDGADTGDGPPSARDAGGPPVFTVPVGSPTAGRDREVLSVTVAEAPLDDARVELAATIVAHGHGRTPIVARLLENGRPVDAREAAPAAEGAPVRVTFRASPPRGAPVVYTVDVPAAAGELVPENNRRSVLVQPPARPRRILLVEGAPGFEHSFLKRALAADTGLEVDSVIRQGRNEQGADTFYVQAARARGTALSSGYPQAARDLFQYDALVLGNVAGTQLAGAQIDATREFVARRGGGLLVLGARSFLDGGVATTALEEVLPVQLRGRGRAQGPAAARGANRVSLTADGELHPIMQLGVEAADTRRRWDAAPALASIAPVGDARPGASVLAATNASAGGAAPLVAVQRYGEGRSMIFAGEASWRWRMMLPASDRSYDTFWRQAVRWLGNTAPDPIFVSTPLAIATGDVVPVRIAVRNEEFQPIEEADVDVRLTAPDGTIQEMQAVRDHEHGAGRYVVHYRADQPGVHRAVVNAGTPGGAAAPGASSFLVGGADVEMSDPRLNARLLQRLASDSGGRMVGPGEGLVLRDALLAAAPSAALAVRRDLWHSGWSFAAILVLLGAEWALRRRFGLR